MRAGNVMTRVWLPWTQACSGSASMRRRGPRRQDPPSVRREELTHALEATPLGHEHEQRLAVVAAEHARETKLVQLDALQHLATWCDAVAARPAVFERGRPDRALSVQAHTVAALTQLGPDATVCKCSVGVDVERGESGLEGFGHEQRLVVRRDDHSVGEVHVV